MTNGPDILRLMERDKQLSPRVLDHGSEFALSQAETREKRINQECSLVWFGWFYGISTFVGYLMPNLIFM